MPFWYDFSAFRAAAAFFVPVWLVFLAAAAAFFVPVWLVFLAAAAAFLAAAAAFLAAFLSRFSFCRVAIPATALAISSPGQINHLRLLPSSSLLTGNFEFADIRGSLDDAFEEADEYRGFEVWDRRNVALVEDRGIIILGDEMVRGVLKALDTGKGSLAAVTEDSRDGWELKRALDKAGKGMFTYGVTDCDIPLVDALRGCKAAVWVIKGGDIDATQWGYVYVFTSERRAESGMDDIEESFLESEQDIDIDLIEIDGNLVIVETTIHHEP